MDDDLLSAEISLDVKQPALDIRSATLRVKRDVLGIVPDLTQAETNLVGVRIGPGMTQIVRGILGGESASPLIAELLIHAMEMLINALTVPELRKATESGGITFCHETDGPKVILNDVVIGNETVRVMAQNPRLKDSCVAFSGF